ncbi:MAG: transmembrane(s)protein [candidate division WS6 bacterium 34_10]|uniref:Transmembrane(S)protein n=1 Tax=candidate division WS6 bacterium 34_10 TaxID=1641389 RepID=A0A101HG10_9BACT|nr:MAG: transmembrane(s)protein [candidate division WS6 bacterium 34_10]
MSNTEAKENNTTENVQAQEVKTPEVTTEQNQPEQKEVNKENGLDEEQKLLLRTGQGINLVPKQSKQEIKKEEKKFSLSISSILSLILLVILSLGIVFYNIISTNQLSSAKQQRSEMESQLQAYSDKYISHQEIIERIDLYKNVKSAVYSPREVVEYVMEIVERQSNIEIRSFNIDDSLEFEMSGETDNLETVAKLWYMLGVDRYILNINLAGVSKTDTGANFSFEGELDRDKFITN